MQNPTPAQTLAFKLRQEVITKIEAEARLQPKGTQITFFMDAFSVFFRAITGQAYALSSKEAVLSHAKQFLDDLEADELAAFTKNGLS